jgi:hypothetical protein
VLKLSLCFFFLRVLVNKWSRWIVIAATTISTIGNLVGCLTFLISCGGPREAAHFLLIGSCIAKPQIDLVDFIRIGIWVPTYTNIAVDIIFSIIPIPMLLSTTLDRKQKVVVGTYLALSTVGVVCAIAKIFFTFGNKGNVASSLQLELGYASLNTSELAAYIIGGCIATYRPLFMALSRKAHSTDHSKCPKSIKDSSASPTATTKSLGQSLIGKFYRSSTASAFDVERGLNATPPLDRSFNATSAIPPPSPPTRPSSIWTNAKDIFTGMAVPYSPSWNSKLSRNSMRLDSEDKDDLSPIKRTEYKAEPEVAMCMYGDGLGSVRPSMARHRRHSENRLGDDVV